MMQKLYMTNSGPQPTLSLLDVKICTPFVVSYQWEHYNLRRAIKSGGVFLATTAFQIVPTIHQQLVSGTMEF